MTHFLVVGASHGLGLSFSMGFPIQADLSVSQTAVVQVAEAIGDRPIDFCLYNAGIWEENAFKSMYSLAAIQTYESTRIPMQDLVLLLRCLRQLSRVSSVKEIHIPAMPNLYA